VPDVLCQHEDRVRGAKVQAIGTARAHMAEADLALAGPGTRPPALLRAASRVWLPFHLDVLDLDLVSGAAEQLLEESDAFHADAGWGEVSETNRPTPRRARMRPSSSSSMSPSRATVRLTFMSMPSSVAVGSMEPGCSRWLRMAPAIPQIGELTGLNDRLLGTAGDHKTLRLVLRLAPGRDSKSCNKQVQPSPRTVCQGLRPEQAGKMPSRHLGHLRVTGVLQ
jgi:hypothetical protein